MTGLGGRGDARTINAWRRPGTHGLVLGGGFAGMLAAAVLARHLDTVTLVERDRFGDDTAPSNNLPSNNLPPNGPPYKDTPPEDMARRGLPQAAHAHLLLARGARTVDALLPGTIENLLARGAHHIGMPNDVLTFTPQGWLPRLPETQFLISCSRALTDAVMRERALRDGRVDVTQGGDAVGLIGDARRVTGAVIRDRDTGETREIHADLVVDATGGNSRAPRWLADLGLPAVPEVVVDAGVGYATRLFRLRVPLPAGGGRFPALYVQADPNGAGQAGVLLPIEGDRWILSVSGVRGAEPPTGEREFAEFIENLRHSVLAEVLAHATPLGPVRGYRNLANRWRRFEKMPSWPEGLVIVGDAARTFNPAYGHGMSVAAMGVQELDRALRQAGTERGPARSLSRDLGRGFAKRAQRAIARTANDAWALATLQDIRYGRTVGARPGLADRMLMRHADLVGRAAAVDPKVTRALLNAYTLSAPLASLLAPPLAPALALAAMRRSDTPMHMPPFTPQEARLLRAISAETGSPAND